MDRPSREQTKHWLHLLRIASVTVDCAVYMSTRGIDVFRDRDAFDRAQNSAAAVAVVLVALGWPS